METYVDLHKLLPRTRSRNYIKCSRSRTWGRIRIVASKWFHREETPERVNEILNDTIDELFKALEADNLDAALEGHERWAVEVQVWARVV